ncbi:MAG TPA: ribosome biogenesis GTPase Der [Bacilli bacterium]|nr:ribosome biogenesis GTPase Der [Bacilli bacterium]
MKLPIVCIVGRPNVGKSTVFNRLIGERVSIIDDVSGITRDRIYGEVSYKNYKFNLIDTGGIDISQDVFNDEIKVQVELAIDEADKIIFIVDGKEGLTKNDYVVREMLRRYDKPVIVAINKVDNKQSEDHIYDFYELGFEDYVSISGEHNVGIIDLLEKIVSGFNKLEESKDDDILKIAVIGRPNVGKSSLVNALLNEERVIVSDVSGTTRDAVDTPFTYNKENYLLIDTAGMRKKGKVYESVEKYSLLRSLKAIDRSDICLLVLNREEGIIEHDKHIAGYAIEKGKGIILVVNKWDTVDDKEEDLKEFTKKIRQEFQFISYAPIVFLSALTKKRVHTLMPEVLKVGENIKKEIKSSILNDVIINAYDLNPAPTYKSKRLKIYFTHQSGKKPPKFTFNVNDKKLVHFSYERYLENKIRENFDLEGTPIILEFKNRR